MLTVTLNPALDVCAHVGAVEPDRKMHCDDVIVQPGGGGINVARVATRMGIVATAAAFLARDCDKRFLELLTDENVLVETIAVGGPLRQSLTVIETSTSRQYRFVLPGSAMARDHFESGLARIAELCVDESLVVVSGSSPPGVSTEDIARLVGVARSSGAVVIADTSGDALAAVAAQGTALLKPSVRELSVYMGRALASHREIEQAGRELLSSGPNGAVLVSLGEAGALLIRPDEDAAWFHAPRVLSLSTVGAGDSLVAGIAVSLERGQNLVDAVRCGVAAGTAATLARGTGLCNTADVERLLPEVLVTGVAQ